MCIYKKRTNTNLPTRHKNEDKEKTMNGIFVNKDKSINFCFFLGCASSPSPGWSVMVGIDLKVAPITTPFSTMPDKINIHPFQP